MTTASTRECEESRVASWQSGRVKSKGPLFAAESWWVGVLEVTEAKSEDSRVREIVWALGVGLGGGSWVLRGRSWFVVFYSSCSLAPVG